VRCPIEGVAEHNELFGVVHSGELFAEDVLFCAVHDGNILSWGAVKLQTRCYVPARATVRSAQVTTFFLTQLDPVAAPQ
jgi:hypothetical protein